jgi:hypothetical protein
MIEERITDATISDWLMPHEIEFLKNRGINPQAVANARRRREADPVWKPYGQKRVMPRDWRVRAIGLDGGAYENKNGLRVVTSVAKEEDGRHWLHVSLSRAGRMPTYQDIAEVKRIFIGEDRKAIFVLPEKARHVSIHDFCLHLWASLEYDPLPNFDEGLGTI